MIDVFLWLFVNGECCHRDCLLIVRRPARILINIANLGEYWM